MNLESVREHEVAFFKDLGNIDLFRSGIISTSALFDYFAEGHIAEKRNELKNLDKEILDYLYFHTAPNARKAYLNRLLETTNNTQAELLRKKVEIIGNTENTITLTPLPPNTIFDFHVPKVQLELFFESCNELLNELK